MTREQAIEVLRKLQYRINVGNHDDPELENAIRLRDRLCSKYGICECEIACDVVLSREFWCNDREEAQVVIQYAFVKLMRKQGEFTLYSQKHTRYGKKKWEVEIPMDDEEYQHHGRIIVELLEMYRRRKAEYKKKLMAAMRKQLQAWDYQFTQQAGLLAEAKPGDKVSAPKWGLHEAMRAAEDLDGAIFPESYLEQQMKALSHAG